MSPTIRIKNPTRSNAYVETRGNCGACSHGMRCGCAPASLYQCQLAAAPSRTLPVSKKAPSTPPSASRRSLSAAPRRRTTPVAGEATSISPSSPRKVSRAAWKSRIVTRAAHCARRCARDRGARARRRQRSVRAPARLLPGGGTCARAVGTRARLVPPLSMLRARTRHRQRQKAPSSRRPLWARRPRPRPRKHAPQGSSPRAQAKAGRKSRRARRPAES